MSNVKDSDGKRFFEMLEELFNLREGAEIPDRPLPEKEKSG